MLDGIDRGSRNEDLAFLSGGGATGALMRAHDWSRSPLGPPHSWPQSLRSVVGLLLGSKFPMFVAWGRELGFLYNDAYAEILGEKHPAALGSRFADIWGEIWPDIAPLIDAAMAGEAIYRENLPLVMNRRGYDEKTWFTFSYSAVRDESGAVAGMFCAVSETTAQVLAQERQAFRLTLEEQLRDLADPVHVMGTAAEAIGRWLGIARVGYGEVDETQTFVTVERDWTNGRVRSVVGRHRLDDFGPPIIAELKAGRTMFASDVTSDPRIGAAAKSFAAIDTRSVLAVPLIKSGRFTAMLFLHHPAPHLWSADEVTLIEEVAERTWAAVERAYTQTARRLAEERLRESEEQLRLATDVAEIGLWDVEHGDGKLYWPPRVKAMFGISADKPVSMEDFFAGLHPEDRDRVSDAYSAAIDPQTRAIYDVEYRTIGKEDRVIRWIAAKGRGVFDTQGRCIRVIGTAMDITRRKADEERLRELNETLERRMAEALAERKLLADIVEGADTFVQVADKNYNWLAINRASGEEFARIFGVSRPHAGDNMLEMLAKCPEHQAAVKEVWSRALAGEEFTEIGEFGDPKLDRRSYDMRFRTIRDESGEVVAAYQFVHDVTERLREQGRLAQAEATLTQVQKMDAIGQLTGGIAHDFNNLLQGVAGSLDLIRSKPDDQDRVRRWAEAGLQAAERGAKLTGQLLAFSRAQKLELKPIELTPLIAGMHDLLARTLGPSIRILLDLEKGDARVLGDQVQLEMAILNLAINARDAMAQGGRLTITTDFHKAVGDPELADGDYATICVADTGDGMAPDVAARAFDPFFTTKGVGQGTGLGLSQVYGTVRQAGGTARIESAVGRGTTVRLFLRCTNAPAVQDHGSSANALKTMASATILVIDDDQDVRNFLSDALTTLGYRTLEAEDGYAGLLALEAARPAAILLDYAMPGMTGAEVAREVRNRWPRLPIIFVSGFSETAAIEATMGRNAQVLRKPFRVRELQSMLARVLDGDAAG